MNETIVISYTTVRDHCSCCQQKLPKPITNKVNQFEFSKCSASSWTDWDAYAEYPEDLESIVPEYVYETLRFFAVSSYDKLIVEDSEIQKVKKWLQKHVIGQNEEEED